MKLIIAFFASLIFCANIFCQVKLPRLISDGMILQRDTKLKIWGWASANEAVKVTLKNITVKTKADAAGNWSVQLPAQKAGGPYAIEIAASNKIVINNVLFGDVWFCSGQSNMVHQMELHGVTYAKDIETANYPQIRQFLIPTATNLNSPQQDVSFGSWKFATPDAVQKFSAVAYFFARKIYEQYHIPIGIINSSVGGTPIEAWSSETGLKDFPEWMKIIQKNKDTAYIGQMNRAAASIKNIPSKDLGLSGNVPWFDTSYTPKGWRTINIPGYWEDQGVKDLNGVVWYRKIIDIPASMTGKAARVFFRKNS
ncbi:MAG: sialate O-acetylesterase [Ferruginibacter sp.]